MWAKVSCGSRFQSSARSMHLDRTVVQMYLIHTPVLPSGNLKCLPDSNSNDEKPIFALAFQDCRAFGQRDELPCANFCTQTSKFSARFYTGGPWLYGVNWHHSRQQNSSVRWRSETITAILTMPVDRIAD
jgi:hypothetical protein